MDDATRRKVLQYDLQALRNNIDRIETNKDEFRKQIEVMDAEQDKLRGMIKVLEEKHAV